MLEGGLARAAARVARGGVLASNTLDETRAVGAALGALFPRRLEIGVRDFDNRVLLAGEGLPSARALRAELGRSPVLRPARAWLRFRTSPRRAGGPRPGTPARSG
jgi:hypothetical protein